MGNAQQTLGSGFAVLGAHMVLTNPLPHWHPKGTEWEGLSLETSFIGCERDKP